MNFLAHANQFERQIAAKEYRFPSPMICRLGLMSFMGACLLGSVSASQAAGAPSLKFDVETRSTNAVYEINGDAISGQYTHVLRGKQTVLLEINDTGVVAVKQSVGATTTMVINFADIAKAMRDYPYSAEDFVEARLLRNDLQGKTINLLGAYQKSASCQSELDAMIHAADTMMDACVLEGDPLDCGLSATNFITVRKAYREC